MPPGIADRGLSASAEIECGSAAHIELLDTDRVLVEPGEDAIPREMQVQGPISCYNACIGLRNEDDERRHLTVEVRIPRWLIEGGFDHFLRRRYVMTALEDSGATRPRPALEWRMVAPERQRDRADSVEVDLSVRRGEAVVLSSVEHYPMTTCNERLREIASHSDSRLRTIGRSAQGRPVFSLDVGHEDAPRRAVFTGTFQPGEPAAWGVMPMIDAALEGGWWLDEYLISFIPQPNPDGIFLGRCNVNARDELVAFGFDEAAAGGNVCPQEVQVLWDDFSARPPAVYVDFHFLRNPDHPYTKPYFIDPAVYQSGEVAEAARVVNGRLMEISGAERPFEVPIGHPLWRGLATYQAATQLDAVSFLYQYTGPTTSIAGAREVGPQVMLAALEACRDIR